MNAYSLDKKQVEANGRKIFYFCDISFPGRPCVVLLHGLSSNYTTWIRIIERLHAGGYNSIAPDLRGHGLSDKTVDKPLYAWPVFADDVRRVLEAEGIEKCVLVGYSFGGIIAEEFIARYPEKVSGMILVGANYLNPLVHGGMRFLTPVCVGLLNFIAFIFCLQRRKQFHYYEHSDAVGYWDAVFDGLTTMPISVNLWMLALYAKIDYRKLLPKIKVPVFIVCAAKDPFLKMVEVKEMNDAISESAIIVSKNLGHFVASRQQDEVSDIIIDFLTQYENRNL